jgi:hypothetical protein
VCAAVEHPDFGSKPDTSSWLQKQNTGFKFCFSNIFSFSREKHAFSFLRSTENQLWVSKRFLVIRVTGPPPEAKLPGREANHFLLSSSEVKNAYKEISFSTGFHDAMLN